MLQNDIHQHFKEFDEILENREKYNLEWAFKDAQNRLDAFKKEIIDTKMKKQCTLCEHQNIITEEFSSFKDSSHLVLKKQKRQARLFTNMFTLLTIVEFILSIILVLAISEISHTGEGLVESEVLGLWIVTTFAFLKVFIERYMLKPRIDDLGWRLYARSIDSLKDMALAFSQQIRDDIVPAQATPVIESEDSYYGDVLDVVA